MTPRLPLLGLVLLAGLAAACTAREETPPPGITAQGFEIEQPRQAAVGAFSDVRLRIEAPGGIDHLVVRERSYEIDLATSPDASQLPLFGIDHRIWSKRDVTLDFSGYLNQKLRSDGEYTVALEVTDRAGRSATAKLQIVVTPAEESGAGEGSAAPEEAARGGASKLAEHTFRLQRVGRGSVLGDDRLGITWKTVDPIFVVIRVSAREGTAGRFARLDPASYEELGTEEALTRALAHRDLVDTLEITTANDAAAGTVLAIVHPEERFVLLAEHSATSLSELGTTVTLTGRYRN